MAEENIVPNEVRKAIYAFFKGIVDRDENGIFSPMTFENNVFADNEPRQSPESEWMRLAVRHYLWNQQTIGPVGSRRFTVSAGIFVQVFTDIGKGQRRGDQVATEVAEAFTAATLPGITLRAATITEGGEENKQSMNIVEIPFTYQQTH